MHACMYVCMYVWLTVCLSDPCVCACVRAYVRAGVHAFMYICMYGWLADCLSVLCAYVRAYVCACLDVSASVLVKVYSVTYYNEGQSINSDKDRIKQKLYNTYVSFRCLYTHLTI